MTESSAASLIQTIQKETRLEVLCRQFPREWAELQQELGPKLQRCDPLELKEFMVALKKIAGEWRDRTASSGNHPKVVKAAFPHILKAKLAFLALDRFYKELLAKHDSGPSGQRLTRYNHFVVKHLLRLSAAKYTPAPLIWLKFWWRFVRQRGTVLSLLTESGTWCIYSAEFIRELARQLQGRRVLEVGAGEGVLSRFLHEAGVDIVGTDNYSWSRHIKFGANVEKREAAEALKHYQPEAVICSWAPPDNLFEQDIFRCPTVETYFAIGSSHHFASGNRDTYQKARGFVQHNDRELASLLFPAESNHEVQVFRRERN
jgi:uncharacterized UPF0146 family protein